MINKKTGPAARPAMLGGLKTFRVESYRSTALLFLRHRKKATVSRHIFPLLVLPGNGVSRCDILSPPHEPSY